MLPNRYEYADCNPSNYVDPSGLDAIDTFNCVGTSGVLVAAGVGMILGLSLITGGVAAIATAVIAQASIFIGTSAAVGCFR